MKRTHVSFTIVLLIAPVLLVQAQSHIPEDPDRAAANDGLLGIEYGRIVQDRDAGWVCFPAVAPGQGERIGDRYCFAAVTFADHRSGRENGSGQDTLARSFWIICGPGRVEAQSRKDLLLAV